MKYIQFISIVVSFSLVGLTNIYYNLDSIRILPRSKHIQTAIVGSSHSNALRYPEWLSAYYLNESGAMLSRKVKQLEMAVKLFSELELVIADVSPAEFYVCGERDEMRYRDILVLDRLELEQVLRDIRLVASLLVVDPRQYLGSPTPRTDSKNGKAFVRETGEGGFGAARHLRACDDGDSISFVESEIALHSLATILKENSLSAILIVAPHTQEYRDELSENKRGGLAIATMSESVRRIESENANICLIDLYDLELEAGSFSDGDHLNKLGEAQVAPILESEITYCLSKFEGDLFEY